MDLLKSGLPWWLSSKESTCNAGDLGSIPGLGRSPKEGNGNLLQYSCLENSLDRQPGGLQFTGLQKSQTQLDSTTTTIKKHKLILVSQTRLHAFRVIWPQTILIPEISIKTTWFICLPPLSLFATSLSNSKKTGSFYLQCFIYCSILVYIQSNFKITNHTTVRNTFTKLDYNIYIQLLCL